jgi:hypothetical protein
MCFVSCILCYDFHMLLLLYDVLPVFTTLNSQFRRLVNTYIKSVFRKQAIGWITVVVVVVVDMIRRAICTMHILTVCAAKAYFYCPTMN